jgi:hypothetical protein
MEGSDMRKLAESTFRAAVLLCALLALAGRVQASPIVFHASGFFTDNSTLSGTITIDPTTGLATAEDLTISGGTSGYVSPLVFDATPPALMQLDNQGAGNVWLDSSDLSNTFQLRVDIPGPTLLGYAGGDLVVSSFPPDGTFFTASGEGGANLVSGSLTAVTTPAPPSIVLLGSALLTVGGFHSVRRRRSSLVCAAAPLNL